jgi:glycosyltransferase involved in cell wall biosynthesis
MKKISIITAVYNEEENVREAHATIRALFFSLPGYDYEHIFMDNCSTDRSLPILREIAAADKKVKILAYSKNFGPIKSEMIGYQHAAGDAVVCFDANLKDPPELIPVFIKHWEDGYDVVYGVRPKTHDNFLMLRMRRIFYRICSLLSDEPLPENAGGFRLVDRRVVNELITLDDYKPYVRGLITSIGFRQIGVTYTRRARQRGESKSDLRYLFDFAINAFISYSITPIRLCTYTGIALSALSSFTAVGYALLKLFYPRIQPPGIATVIILLFFFSGIQLFFLGVMGEYIGAIHSQVRKKPFVVIREKINFGG